MQASLRVHYRRSNAAEVAAAAIGPIPTNLPGLARALPFIESRYGLA